MVASSSLPDVIVTNLNPYFTGVTATLENLYPLQARQVSLGLHGYDLSFATRKVSVGDLVLHGRVPPRDKPFRIYHARRAVELRRGLFLRDFCGVKIKVIFTSVKQLPHSYPLRRMISRCDGVIATTEGAARLRPHVLKVIPHGIDVARFCPTPRENWFSYARRQGLPGRRAIAQLGNIRKQKGTDIFVRALCRVLPRFPDVVGVVVGRWILKDALLRYRLERMTHAAGIGDRVLWLGQISHEEIPSLYRAVDICVAAARYEDFGLTIGEAMSCGTPGLATLTGGFPLVVDEGRTGFLVPCGDEDALAERLSRFLAQKDEKTRMTRACRVRAEKLFPIEREATSLVSVYRSLWQGGCVRA